MSATLPPSDAATLAEALREIAREAGELAQRWFRPGETSSARSWSKSGGSPVTEADVSVDTFLKVRLSALVPEAGWLSEETRDDPARLGRPLVWIVDPIDGTRAYIAGLPDWSVAIALLVDGSPALGVVHAPAREGLYEARAGAGARLEGEPIHVRADQTLADTRVAGPKPMIDQLMRRAGAMTAAAKIPSLALRLSRIAAGEIDVALVSANARDWDLAAADLVLAEAGGALSDPVGTRPVYNRPDPVHGVLVGASRALHPRLIGAMTGDDTHTRRLARAT